MDTDDLLIGKFVWNSIIGVRVPILFFDNSGIDYRCIWTIDPYSGEVKKIIPEHEAIHPFYFVETIVDSEYLLYVEGNSIKKAVPPEDWFSEYFTG